MSRKRGRGGRRRQQSELLLEVPEGDESVAPGVQGEAADATILPEVPSVTEPVVAALPAPEPVAVAPPAPAPEPVVIAPPAPAPEPVVVAPAEPPAVFEFVEANQPGKTARRPVTGSKTEVPRHSSLPRAEPAPSPEREIEILVAAAERSEDPALLTELADVFLARAKYTEAEHWLRQAQRLDPAKAEIRTKLGIVAFRRGLCVQAEADLLWACERDPQDWMAHLYRGEALNQLGRIDEAMEAVELALRIHSDHARTNYLMGILLDRKNRHQESAAMYRRARELSGL